LAGIYAIIFTGFVTWYLPREFDRSRESTKSDIENAVSPIRKDLAVLTERVRKEVAFNLQSLVPSPQLARALDPAVVKARLQEADSLIASAIEERIPTSPAILRITQDKLHATAEDPMLSRELRATAAGTLVRFEAYNVFSAITVVVNAPKIVISQDGTTYAPVTVDRPIWFEGTGKDGATLTVDFTVTHPPYPHPAAFVLARGNGLLSKMHLRGKENSPHFLILKSRESRALVADSKIENLTQGLGGITWVNVDFVDSVIRFYGEPTFLGNVTFRKCKFEFGNDPASRWLLSKLGGQQGPITLASDIRF
jgi:hypothetical protein